jgi:hypothetical protein
MDWSSGTERWDPMTRPHQRIPGKLLELFVPANAALAGDLVEEYERRGSALWYWRQVLSAIAIAVATDIGSHKILMVRAITVGWTTMWLFSFVAVEINGFMSGWVLDRLILLFWTHPFPMIWATQLSTRPSMALSFLISGWIVGRLHRHNRPAMLIAFMLTVLAWSIYNDAMRLLRPSSIPMSYHLVRLLLIPLPLLILVGGFWRSIAVARRNGDESITA